MTRFDSARFDLARRRVALALGTGYVLYFFSERVFWSFWRPGDSILEQVAAWLFYSLLAEILLQIVTFFRVRRWPALFLAGAAFGWLNEGVFAMTLFGDPSMPFPFTIAWTGLAWHAPLSVCIGWCALRLALEADGLRPTLLLSIVLGAFWGFWSLSWSLETPPLRVDAAAYLVHGVTITVLLAAAELAIGAGLPTSPRPTRLQTGVAAGLVLAFFCGVTVPTVSVAALALPLLLVAVLGVLWRCGDRETASDVTGLFGRRVRVPNLMALLAMPLMATAIYATGEGAGTLR